VPLALTELIQHQTTKTNTTTWDGFVVPGWQIISVCNQSPRSTQPSIPQVYVNRVLACLAGVKAGRVHLHWVALR